MRLLVTSDPHLTDEDVAYRSDSMRSTVLSKLSAISAAIVTHQVEQWLVPGDLFHNAAHPNHWVCEQLIRTLKDTGTQMILVMGQHDMRGGTTTNSPLIKMLEATGLVHCISGALIRSSIMVFGVPFNHPLPDPDLLKPPKGGFNILMLHQPIGASASLRKLGAIKYHPQELIDKYKSMDLIIAGDIHEPYTCFRGPGEVSYINTGPLMRLNYSERNLPCQGIVVDTGMWKAKWVTLGGAVTVNPAYVKAQQLVKKITSLDISMDTNPTTSTQLLEQLIHRIKNMGGVRGEIKDLICKWAAAELEKSSSLPE